VSIGYANYGDQFLEDENDIRRPRASLSANTNAEEVGYYARAYMLDLLSSIMFSDYFGFLQSMYLQYIQDIDSGTSLVCIEGYVMLQRQI
jgi:hypothetical protein